MMVIQDECGFCHKNKIPKKFTGSISLLNGKPICADCKKKLGKTAAEPSKLGGGIIMDNKVETTPLKEEKKEEGIMVKEKEIEKAVKYRNEHESEKKEDEPEKSEDESDDNWF
jgi:hypothetical protein